MKRIFEFEAMQCPECGQPIVRLAILKMQRSGHPAGSKYGGRIKVGAAQEQIVWPKHRYHEPCAPEAPEQVAEDYNEACLVIDISPTAAAALARRGLELVLKKNGAEGNTLYDMINDIIDNKKALPFVTGDLHDLRNIGNTFAAHANRIGDRRSFENVS